MRLTKDLEEEIRHKVDRQRSCGEPIDYLWRDQYHLLAEIDALRDENQSLKNGADFKRQLAIVQRLRDKVGNLNLLLEGMTKERDEWKHNYEEACASRDIWHAEAMALQKKIDAEIGQSSVRPRF